MTVDGRELGHGQGVRWDLPGKPDADEDVRFVAAEQRRDPSRLAGITMSSSAGASRTRTSNAFP